MNDNATLTPFSSVILADTEGNNLSLAIVLDASAKGTLSATSIVSGSVATVQAALRAITFNPTDNQVAVGSTETTTFTLTAHDGTEASTPNNTTTVVSTSINDTPTDMALSNNSVNQSSGANAAIGTLSSSDVDSGERFTYTFVAGTGDTDNASFTISGDSLQATDASALSAGTYSVRVQTDDGGNNGLFATAFSITVVDDINPTLSTLSPTDDATDTSPSANLVLTLNEEAVIGTGHIVIKQTSDDAVVETMDVAGEQVSVSGAVVTLNPSVTLAPETAYYVQIEATALEDTAGNAYAGISDTDTTSWNFTVAAGSTRGVNRNPRSRGSHRDARNPRHYRNNP